MPNQRAPGQKAVTFPLDEKLLAALDESRGGRSRSDVIREAIYKHLAAKGYELPSDWMDAPDRVGKGGRPKGQSSNKKAPRKKVSDGTAKKDEGRKKSG